ncbi:hypothetical protein K7432_005035 [Basidiobolus ranarum]|uniref:O-acyltransferase n=1 Tax=Basidiobolus ranarum TaxID=34480 RepID=A0ABR2W3Q2_9FUNG
MAESNLKQRKRDVAELTDKPVEQPVDEKKPQDKGKELDQYAFKHTRPAHIQVRHSALSKDAPQEDYRGFLNLAMLLLFVTNIRLIVENYQKYGFLINVPGHDIPKEDYPMSFLAYIILPINVLVAFSIEKIALILSNTLPKNLANSQFPSPYRYIISGLHIANILCSIVLPSYICYTQVYHPALSTIVLFMACALMMKLISYYLVNRDMRDALFSGQPIDSYDVSYPNNITLKDAFYFWFVPTLCYQPSYPRTPRFRRRFFFKRLTECLSATFMMYFLVEQYAKPTLWNSVKAMEEQDLVIIIERVMKLSTIVVLVWLLGFFAFFHAYLNCLAEILHFGDRAFYLPWWNNTNLGEYWRLWNQPVHKFFKRHTYVPFRRAGISPFGAMCVTFFISAVLHELLIGIPTHIVSGLAFWGMLGQIPMVMLTGMISQKFPKSSAGNIVFWVSFCILGQPFMVVSYYYQWNKKYYLNH